MLKIKGKTKPRIDLLLGLTVLTSLLFGSTVANAGQVSSTLTADAQGGVYSLKTVSYAPPFAIGLDPGAPISASTGGISFDGARIRDSGSTWVRINFILGPWSAPGDATRRGPGNLTWFETYDRIVNDAVARGLRPYGLIGGEAVHSSHPINSDAYVADYVANFAAIVDHFKDRVRYFESFNEPNDWAGGTSAQVTPTYFAKMLEQIYRAVKVAHWDDSAWREVTLVSGPLLSHDQDTAEPYFTQVRQAGVNQLGWGDLKDNYGTYPLDGLGYHLYVAQGTADRATVQSKMKANLDAIWGTLTALEGSGTAKRLWISEIGWNTASVSEADQATNVDTALDLLRADPRVTMTSWFVLRDFGETLKWGLERSDGSRKPGWSNFVEQAGQQPPNQPPVAQDQNLSTPAGSPLEIQLIASDPDNDTLTYAIVDGPSHGALTGDQDGDEQVTYTPDAGFSGEDTFTFKANDGTSDSNVATVSITVATGNQPPVASDDSVGVSQGLSLLIRMQATDPEGDNLTYVIQNGPSHGTLTGDQDGDEWVTYTPEASYLGSDSFTFKANDGTSDSNLATVTITVTESSGPVAQDQSVKTLTDWPTAIHLQASDPDDMPLTYTIVDLPSNGSLEDYEDGDALLTYFSNLDFTGEDSFTFKVSNGLQESNLATVSIAVVDALSWTPQSRVNDIAPGGSVDFPAVALQGNTAYAAWYASERNGDIGIFFNKSLDGGLTWGPDDRFVSPVTLDNPTIARLSIDVSPDGALAIAWNVQGYLDNSSAFEIHVAHSSDGGQSWQDVLVTDEYSTWRSQLAFDQDGTLYLAWERASRIKVARSFDGGQSWEPPVVAVEGKGGECDLRWDFAAAGSGVAYIALHECGLGLAKSLDGGLTWSDPFSNPIGDDFPPSSLIEQIAITLDGPEDPHVAWAAYDGRQLLFDVFYTASHDGGLTWSPPRMANDWYGRVVLDSIYIHVDIAVLGDGTSLVGWSDDYYVVLSGSFDGGLNWHQEMISDFANHHPNFALASDPSTASGNAVAVWQGHHEDSADADPAVFASSRLGVAKPFDLQVSSDALTLNDDGWYAENPLEVRATLNCPPDHDGPCRGGLTLVVGDPGQPDLEGLRFYVAQASLLPEEGFTCRIQGDELVCTEVGGERILNIQANGQSPTGLNSFHSYRFTAAPLEVPAGSSETYTWLLWVQPQAAQTMPLSARWVDLAAGDGELTDRASVSIPSAQIHPIVFLPGAGATQPPTYNQELADVVLFAANRAAHYNDFYEGLQKTGYEKGRTLFLFPYDWLRSNVESAQHLRDDRLRPAAQIAATVPWVAGNGDPNAVDFDLVGHSTGVLVSRAYIQGEFWEENVHRFVSIGGPHLGVTRGYTAYEGIEPGRDFLDMSVYYLWAPPRARRAGYGRVTCLPLLGCRWTWNMEDRYQFAHDPIHGLNILPEFLPTYHDQLGYLVNANGTPPEPAGDFPFGRMANPLLEGESAVDHVSVLDPYTDNEDVTADPEGFKTTYYGLNTSSAIQLMDGRLGGIAENVCIIHGTGTNQDTVVALEVAEPQGLAPYWYNGKLENHLGGLGDNTVPAVSANPAALWPAGQEPRSFDLDQALAARGEPEANHARMVGYDLTITETARCLTGTEVPAGMLNGYSSGGPGIATLLNEDQGNRILVVTALNPVELTLTDPQSRRLGFNPAGDDFTEIPSGFYLRDGETGRTHLVVYDPDVGGYTLTVTGTQAASGEYVVLGEFQEGDQVVNLFSREESIDPGAEQTQDLSVPQTVAESPTPPEVWAGPDRVTNVGLTISFSGTVTDVNPTDSHTYKWDFGDGTTAEDSLKPTHRYDEAGLYTVSLAVTDSAGFEVHDSLQVTVKPPDFADVPPDHRYYPEIEALFNAGYIAGCETEPVRKFCPSETMTRAQSAVFVERGIHRAGYIPEAPEEQVFDDVPIGGNGEEPPWYAKWANALWVDGFTAGCSLEKLAFCPDKAHTRAEATVFYVRMLRGTDFIPEEPSEQIFDDVPVFEDSSLNPWYANWVHAAYEEGLVQPCEKEPGINFCPEDPLSRAVGAYMMYQAKRGELVSYGIRAAR